MLPKHSAIKLQVTIVGSLLQIMTPLFLIPYTIFLVQVDVLLLLKVELLLYVKWLLLVWFKRPVVPGDQNVGRFYPPSNVLINSTLLLRTYFSESSLSSAITENNWCNFSGRYNNCAHTYFEVGPISNPKPEIVPLDLDRIYES